MNHKRLGHIHNFLYGSLGFTILMLGINSGKTQSLVVPRGKGLESTSFEDVIVTIVMLDLGARLLVYPLFKMLISHYGLVMAQRNLILNPNNTRRCILVDGSTMIAIILGFSSKSLGQMTRGRDHKLINRDKVAKFVLLSHWCSLFSFKARV